MNHALLIAGHGSRDPEGVAEFVALARHFRTERPDLLVEIAFLEFARPTIQEAVDRLVEQGVQTIVVLPGVLFAAGHAKNDMASEVRSARERHPHLHIRMGRALDVHAKLLQLCRLRYEQALVGRSAVTPAETLLLVVGRGSNDPDANSNLAKITRLLHEGYGTGWAACAFSGIAAPLLPDALRVCERMGFRRIVVQPYFLFTGVLLKRIYADVAERRAAMPQIEYIAAPHLQAHTLLFEAFMERVEEGIRGEGHMNCSLCQYRVAIIGHEHCVGEPQQPHHHHVQGLHHDHVHHLNAAAMPGHDAPRASTSEERDVHLWNEQLRERLHF